MTVYTIDYEFDGKREHMTCFAESLEKAQEGFSQNLRLMRDKNKKLFPETLKQFDNAAEAEKSRIEWFKEQGRPIPSEHQLRKSYLDKFKPEPTKEDLDPAAKYSNV